MATSAQRIADLEERLADLTALFAELERDAFTLKTLSEMRLKRAALAASQPRNLRVVQGGRR
jgi:hypothetical protein